MALMISVMARRKCSNQRPGYIDARPLTASSAKPLATHGRTIHWGQTRMWRAIRKRSRFTPMSGHRPTRADWSVSSADFVVKVGCGRWVGGDPVNVDRL